MGLVRVGCPTPHLSQLTGDGPSDVVTIPYDRTGLNGGFESQYPRGTANHLEILSLPRGPHFFVYPVCFDSSNQLAGELALAPESNESREAVNFSGLGDSR